MEQASSDNERVVDFLYVLMRDHLVPGVAEEIVQNFVEKRDQSRYVDGSGIGGAGGKVYPIMKDDQPNTFSNQGLEQYARELTRRLHATLDH